LLGATNSLPLISVVICELSVAPLYKNQPLYNEVISMLDSFGFELWGLWPEHAEDDQMILQYDGVFVNTKIRKK